MTHHPRPKPLTHLHRVFWRAAPAATYFLECMDGRSQHIANVLAAAEELPPYISSVRVRYRPDVYDRLLRLDAVANDALSMLEMIRAAHGRVRR